MTRCMLLPPDHALLPEDLVCFDGIKLPARGMRVAGAPLGDDVYCADFVGQKVDAALAKCRACAASTRRWVCCCCASAACRR